MTWRKWVVRGLVYTFIAGSLVLYLGYQVLTNPTATRRKVLDKLNDRFVGATISLDSARLNLLDGISVSELRMARRDDLDKTDFLHVPSAVIYHDKEQMLDGKLALRKIVLNRPQFRVLIDRNGACNLVGLLAPVDPHECMPTLVIKDGTIVIEDRRLTAGKPVLEVRNVNLTIVNDPLPELHIDGNGRTDVLGLLQFHAKSQRVGGALSATMDLPGIPIGPPLVQRLTDFVPDVGAQLRSLKANAKVHVSLSWQPSAPLPLDFTVAGEIADGQFNHVQLAFPLEEIEGSFQFCNAPAPVNSGESGDRSEMGEKAHPLSLRFPTIHLTAKGNLAHLEVNIKDLVLPPLAQIPKTRVVNTQPGFRLDDDLPLKELTYKIEHLAVTPDLFRFMPEAVQQMNVDYKPCGPVSITHHYHRPRPGKWEKHYLIQPEGMDAEYLRFPYPLHAITGTIERTQCSDHSQHVSLDLAGYGGDRPVTLKGTVEGERGVGGLDFVIAADNVPLDDRLMRALPPRHQAVASQFHPEGLGNIRAYIKRDRGATEFSNRYVLVVHDAALKYDIFPFRLEQVTGELTILPDHWECRAFHGRHQAVRDSRDFYDVSEDTLSTPQPAASEIWVKGRSYPQTDQGPARIHLLIQGRDVLLNKEFEEALAPPGIPARACLQRTWRTLGLAGHMGFNAEVIDFPAQPKDIDVGVSMQGCGMKPKFFPYSLSDVSATVHYARDQVDVTDVRARHGRTQLAFQHGQVLLRPEDGFHIEIGERQGKQLLPGTTPGLVAQDVVVDAAFLAALPPVLRKGLAALKLEGPVDLKSLLVVDQKDGSKPPEMWWDGGVLLPGNTLQTGVEVKDAQGTLFTCGKFDGQQMESLVGNLVLDRATVLGQPVTKIRSQVQVLQDSPQTLRFRNLSGQFFGGQFGCEAHVEFSPKLRYEVILKGLNIELEQFGRHNFGSQGNTSAPVQGGPPDIAGQAIVALYLTGTGTEVEDLKGNGSVDVPNGKLYRLPLLLDLLKAVGLRTPDGTAFEQAHMKFAIENGKLLIENVELDGNPISLHGQGTVNLDGSHVNLDFNADWGFWKVAPRPIQMLPQTLSDQLLKIKVRGKIGDLHFEKELMPGVVDPLKKMFGKSP